MKRKEPKKKKKKRQKAGSPKCSERERIGCELAQIALARSRLRLFAEKELVSRTGREKAYVV